MPPHSRRSVTGIHRFAELNGDRRVGRDNSVAGGAGRDHIGAVKSGPAPVVKVEEKVTGLPTRSRTPLRLIDRAVFAGSGALGTKLTRVLAELNQ